MESKPCPSCGRCPTCGKGGTNWYPNYPWWQQYPYPYTTWTDGSTSTPPKYNGTISISAAN